MNPESFILKTTAAVRNQWPTVIVVIGIGFVVALVAARLIRPTYTAETSVLMVDWSGSTNAQDASTGAKPVLSADLPSLATNATVLNRLRADIGERVPLDRLRKRIRSSVNPQSLVMPMEYSAKTPEAAVFGANALGDEITRFYREIATARFDSLIADLRTQMKVRQIELRQMDTELAARADAYPYVDVRTSAEAGFANTSAYQRLVVLEAEREQSQAMVQSDTAIASATARLISNSLPLATQQTLEASVSFRNVRDQYAKDYADLLRINSTANSHYPGLVELRRIVAKEHVAMLAVRQEVLRAGPVANEPYLEALNAETQANTKLAGDKAEARSIDESVRALRKQIGRSGVATDIAALRRDRDNAETAYSIIAARLAKTVADRAEAASTGSVSILDRASFARSSFGKPAVVFGVLFLSAWFALTAAVLLDNRQDSFRDSRVAELVYGAPFLGSVAS